MKGGKGVNALHEEYNGYTIEDIEALPEGTRAELIDGHIYYMSAPSLEHQMLSASLHAEIYNYIKSHNGSCRALAAPFAVYLNADNSVYLEPDISVICDKDKLSKRGCYGAPDWVIEIVSPSTGKLDYGKKLFLYRTAGVKEYWIVDPKDSSVMVFDFMTDETEKFSFDEEIKGKLFKDFAIKIEIM